MANENPYEPPPGQVDASLAKLQDYNKETDRSQILGIYVNLAKTDVPLFVKHYECISAVAGYQTPENHVDAVAETVASDTLSTTAGMYAERFLFVNILAYAWAIGAYKFASGNNLFYAFAGMLTIHLGYAAYIGINAWLLRVGAKKIFMDRSSVMRAYVNAVMRRIDEKLTKENEERRND